jgi:hypothetical protein
MQLHAGPINCRRFSCLAGRQRTSAHSAQRTMSTMQLPIFDAEKLKTLYGTSTTYRGTPYLTNKSGVWVFDVTCNVEYVRMPC